MFIGQLIFRIQGKKSGERERDRQRGEKKRDKKQRERDRYEGPKLKEFSDSFDTIRSCQYNKIYWIWSWSLLECLLNKLDLVKYLLCT